MATATAIAPNAGGNLAPAAPSLAAAVAGGNLAPATPGLTQAAWLPNPWPVAPSQGMPNAVTPTGATMISVTGTLWAGPGATNAVAFPVLVPAGYSYTVTGSVFVWSSSGSQVIPATGSHYLCNVTHDGATHTASLVKYTNGAEVARWTKSGITAGDVDPSGYSWSTTATGQASGTPAVSSVQPLAQGTADTGGQNLSPAAPGAIG